MYTESEQPNAYLQGRISAVACSATTATSFVEVDTRSELDSHANMCVFKTCSVTPFSDSLGQAKDVPICDIAVAYDSIVDGVHETLILIFRNALCIPEMGNNLIPPFILREAGHTVNDCPKFQLQDPTTEDHCILLANNSVDATIPLQLHGTC